MKWLRWLGIVLGISLAAVLITEVGWITIRGTLGLLGWKYLIVLIYPLSWMSINTLAWRFACHPQNFTISLLNMMGIRMAGETFNSLLPSGYVGGEALKAKLLSQSVPLREATSSVLIAKAAQSISLIFYIGAGLVIGLPATASSADKMKAWIALSLLAAGVGIFTILLANRSFSRVGRMLHSVTRIRWLQAQEPRLLALDDTLGAFYRQCKGRFLTSIVLHGVGWIAGMFELFVIFTLIGSPISWQQAWFIGALAQLGAVIGLMSPGGLGFFEGGHYMAALLLGLPPSLGVSVSLIRRVREIFWDGMGLYFFNRYAKEKAVKLGSTK